jgi:hypothetical protein
MSAEPFVANGWEEWYDAFDDPLLVDESILEAALERFCAKLGVRYSQRKTG